MKAKAKEELAKTLIDLGKLVFGGVVIGLVVQFDTIDKIILASTGLILTFMMIILGLIILNK